MREEVPNAGIKMTMAKYGISRLELQRRLHWSKCALDSALKADPMSERQFQELLDALEEIIEGE